MACADDRLVATAVSPTRARTLEHLRRSLPAGVAHRVADEDRSDFVEKTIALLAELEAGHEEHKTFSLATEYVGEPLAGVLKVAAAIPLGYVTSYGNIAKASGAEARDVGQDHGVEPPLPHRALPPRRGRRPLPRGLRGQQGPERAPGQARPAAEGGSGLHGGAGRAWSRAGASGSTRSNGPSSSAEKHGRADDRQRSLFE